MTYNPEKHHRRSIRLKNYDYTRSGNYFITICVVDRAAIFGRIVEGRLVLNPLGELVASIWQGLPRSFSGLEIDEFVVMPNHFHGILRLGDRTSGDPDGLGRTGMVGDPDGLGRTGMVGGPDGLGRMGMVGDPDGLGRTGMVGDPDGLGRTGMVGDPDDVRAKHWGDNFSCGPRIDLPNASPLRIRTQRADRPNGTVPGSMNAIVQNFKSISTRKINTHRKSPGQRIWQRDYYERIIWEDAGLQRVRKYIINNPRSWNKDKFHR